VKYCNLGSYGFYYLNSVGKIVDSGSTYSNNSAQSGGVYYIQGKTNDYSLITISNCDYMYSYGTLGGVFALYDTFEANIADRNF
jgi:hypothetical protein